MDREPVPDGNVKTELRGLTAEDAAALHAFFLSMPPEDRTFFFQDVKDPSVAEAWASDPRRVRRCACSEDGRIVAFTALRPGVDWSSHVAELVLVVAPHARRQGLGKTLARGMLLEAVQHGYKKITVMIAADNLGAIEMFRRLGFEGEALLRDHLRSPEDQQLRDIVILSHIVHDQWSTMLTGGLDEAVA